MSTRRGEPQHGGSHNGGSEETCSFTEKRELYRMFSEIQSSIKVLQEQMQQIQQIQVTFVNKDRFRPIELVVYGLCSVFGSGLVGAALAFFLRTNS